jgi:hypothetical protein
MCVPSSVFCVLFVCKCVLYYCYRVSTQLLLNNNNNKKIKIIIIEYKFNTFVANNNNNNKPFNQLRMIEILGILIKNMLCNLVIFLVYILAYT